MTEEELSDELINKLDLAERGLRIMPQSASVHNLWLRVRELALEVDDEFTFDKADRIISTLEANFKPRPRPVKE